MDFQQENTHSHERSEDQSFDFSQSPFSSANATVPPPEENDHRNLQQAANKSGQVRQLMQLQQSVNQSPRMTMQRQADPGGQGNGVRTAPPVQQQTAADKPVMQRVVGKYSTKRKLAKNSKALQNLDENQIAEMQKMHRSKKKYSVKKAREAVNAPPLVSGSNNGNLPFPHRWAKTGNSHFGSSSTQGGFVQSSQSLSNGSPFGNVSSFHFGNTYDNYMDYQDTRQDLMEDNGFDEDADIDDWDLMGEPWDTNEDHFFENGNFYYQGDKEHDENFYGSVPDYRNGIDFSDPNHQISMVNGSQFGDLTVGSDREWSQSRVMGYVSPNKAAAIMGLPCPNKLSWEWLHLVAFSIKETHVNTLSNESILAIGVTNQPQQIRENLVLGTCAANTAMLAFEANIKFIMSQNRNLRLNLVATAHKKDQGIVYEGSIKKVPVANKIQYDFQFFTDQNQYTPPVVLTFDTQSHDKPLANDFEASKEGLQNIVDQLKQYNQPFYGISTQGYNQVYDNGYSNPNPYGNNNNNNMQTD